MPTTDLFYYQLWCRTNIGLLQHSLQTNYNQYHQRCIENVSKLQEMALNYEIITMCHRETTHIHMLCTIGDILSSCKNFDHQKDVLFDEQDHLILEMSL